MQEQEGGSEPGGDPKEVGNQMMRMVAWFAVAAVVVLVIVPNSLIGQNRVTNYSYPDPSYRIKTTVSVAYGTDIEVAERLIIDAVRQVPGVLDEKEIEVLYDEMADWAMTLGIRWWIQSYQDAPRVRDQVHRALQKTLVTAGIEMPYPTQTLRLQNNSGVNDDRPV